MATRKSDTTTPDFPRPFTTVDVLIFTVVDDALKVLLVQGIGQSCSGWCWSRSPALV